MKSAKRLRKVSVVSTTPHEHYTSQSRNAQHEETKPRQKKIAHKRIFPTFSSFDDPPETSSRIKPNSSLENFVERDQPEIQPHFFVEGAIPFNDKFRTTPPPDEENYIAEKYTTDPYKSNHNKENKLYIDLAECITNLNHSSNSFNKGLRRSNLSKNIDQDSTTIITSHKEQGNAQLHENVNYIANRKTAFDEKVIKKFRSQHPVASRKNSARSKSSTGNLKQVSRKKSCYKRVKSNSSCNSTKEESSKRYKKHYLPLSKKSSTSTRSRSRSKSCKKLEKRESAVSARTHSVQSENQFLRRTETINRSGTSRIIANKKKYPRNMNKTNCKNLSNKQFLEFIEGDQMELCQIESADKFEKTIKKLPNISRKTRKSHSSTIQTVNFANLAYDCGDKYANTAVADFKERSALQKRIFNRLFIGENNLNTEEFGTDIDHREKITREENRTRRNTFIENFITSSSIPERSLLKTEEPLINSHTLKANNEENVVLVSSCWPQKHEMSSANQNSYSFKKNCKQRFSPTRSGNDGKTRNVAKKTFSGQSNSKHTTKTINDHDKWLMRELSSAAPTSLQLLPFTSKTRTIVNLTNQPYSFGILGDKCTIQSAVGNIAYEFLVGPSSRADCDNLLNQRGPQEVKYGLLLPPNRSPLKILLVFHQTDPVSDAMSRAADKLGFDVTFCNSYDGALEEFLSKLHDLVIIDTRTTTKSLDYDTLCRSIRNTKGSQHTVVVAIVKKSAFDKDDVTVLALLDSGYSRCIVETSNIVHCVNELIQLKHSDMRPMAQAATSQALYAALDKARDIVLITDDSYRLQYANRASELNLGFRHDETLGKTLQEQLIYDSLQMNPMSSSLMRAREWQGQISLRRKGQQEAVVSVCKAVPITCAGRAPTHFVMVMDISGITVEPMVLTPDKPRGSVHSIRRTSADVRSVGSDFLRRSSLAKLSALPLEAPITKIITLLAQAQEQSNPQVISVIDKAVDILRSTELYSPHVKDDLRLRSDEPVTSDLISALLTQQPIHTSVSVSSRRSSNDSSSVIRNANRPVSKVKIPVQIKDLLDTSLTWEFDIFRLEELTNKRPLVHLGMNLFNHFDVANTLNCDEKTLYNWLTVIEMNYHIENSYHNSTHAADVMQATAGFLEKDRLKSIMEPLDEATSLLAAAAHDVDHPGKSSAFLSNCDNPLAILYNDVTVLENHHAALTFKLTLGDDRVNIFKHLERDIYKVARHNVIDMILATEMTKHFEHLAKFVNVFCSKPATHPEMETEEYIPITLPENITLVKRMMIKCADVSNPTRPLRLCVEWARRIAEEYFTQTDEEKARGLPVVMPMFDRTTCSIPKSQIGFVDYIVHDMFEAWDAFIDMAELVSYMRQNYIRWKEFDEQGHTTAADIRKLQNTVLMVPMFPSKTTTKRTD